MRREGPCAASAATPCRHGTTDTTVLPVQSANLQSVLSSNSVPNSRVLFDGIGHDLSNNPATEDAVLQLIREWFTSWGLFGATNATPRISLSVSNHGALKLTWDRAALRTTIERSANVTPWLPTIVTVTNRFEWADPNPVAAGVFYRIQQAE